MSQGFINLVLDGGEGINAGLEKLELMFSDWRKPLKKAIEVAAESVEKAFLTGGEGEWAPLSAATIARTPGRAGGPLMNDLALMGAATDTTGNDPGSLYELKNDKAAIGVDTRKFPGAMALNYGYPDNNLPGREFERLTNKDIISMEDIFSRRFDAMLGEAFP